MSVENNTIIVVTDIATCGLRPKERLSRRSLIYFFNKNLVIYFRLVIIHASTKTKMYANKPV